MPETYQTWDINSVGDAPDNGTTPGCGTKEVANIKHIIDKVGPPNAHRLLEIGTPANGAFVKIDDATNYHGVVSSILSEATNGIDINKATGEAYVSLSSGGYAKAWISKEATTDDLALSTSGAGATTLRVKQTNGNVGIGQIALPAGVLHVLKDTLLNSQLGINRNVGPVSAGFVRDSVSGMVNFSDSGTLTNNAALQFYFSGNYQGIMGHGEIHAYDKANGNSYFCHFTIRFSEETAETITLDFGDIGEGAVFFANDAGAGIRIFVTTVAGPNYNPILDIRQAFGHDNVDISYNIYLRKLLFS